MHVRTYRTKNKIKTKEQKFRDQAPRLRSYIILQHNYTRKIRSDIISLFYHITFISSYLLFHLDYKLKSTLWFFGCFLCFFYRLYGLSLFLICYSNVTDNIAEVTFIIDLYKKTHFILRWQRLEDLYMWYYIVSLFNMVRVLILRHAKSSISGTINDRKNKG